MSTEEEPLGDAAEEVERLLLEAHLLQRRGQPEEAATRCEQVLALDPRAWEAHVLVGDILSDRGQPAEALEHYRAARELVPEQASVEEKIARATLAEAERDRLRAAPGQAAAAEGEAVGPPRNPNLAALLSLVLPGLGQGYNRQLVKGIVILGLVLVLWVVVFFQVGAHVRDISEGLAQGASVDYLQAVSTPGIMLWLALLFLAWFYSIVDAALVASRLAGGRRDII